MSLKIVPALALMTASLKAADLRFECDESSLLIPERSVTFVYAYERKIAIGTSSGAVFQVTPQKEDWGVVDYFRCIRLAIEMLLEQKGDPLADKGHIDVLRELKRLRGLDPPLDSRDLEWREHFEALALSYSKKIECAEIQLTSQR